MDELNGRTAHVWGGGDRKEAINALADTIAKALPLYDRNGDIVVLDSATGQLAPLGRNKLQALIDKHIAGVRLEHRDGYTFSFAPSPHPGPATWPPQPEPWRPEPGLAALNEIFNDLVRRLPKVEHDEAQARVA